MTRNLAPLAVAIALAGCANPSATMPPEHPAPTENTSTGTPAQAGASALRDALPRYHWRLREATDKDGARITALFARDDRPLTLDFMDGRVSVSNTCNRMSGPYTLDGAALAVGNLVSTMMACVDPKLMDLDHAIGARLKQPLQATLAGDATSRESPRLQLATAGGDVLRFEGEATADTRYGGAGETVFLEVAAHDKPCPHGTMADATCLQVREVRYDVNGVRIGNAGAFENLYQPIEGYAHEPGVRNVLRVRRYRIANPPADAPDRAYVLDMVVESAIEDRGAAH